MSAETLPSRVGGVGGREESKDDEASSEEEATSALSAPSEVAAAGDGLVGNSSLSDSWSAAMAAADAADAADADAPLPATSPNGAPSKFRPFDLVEGAEGHTVDESQAKPAAPGVPAPQPQAVYVADVTVPDGSFFEPGSTFPKVQPLLHRRHPAASPCGISGVLFEPCV